MPDNPHSDKPKSNVVAILDELAARAARYHLQHIDAWLACAAVLAQAREIADHGDWLPFLKEAGIGERTAQRMLRVHRAGFKSDIVTDLGGVTSALDYLDAMDSARDHWRDWCKIAESSPHFSALETARVVQSAPDGPISGARWLEFGNACIDAMDSPDFGLAIRALIRDKAPWRRAA